MMNISLTPKLEKYVRKKVASGLYNNASEVMREALRLLVEREGAAAETRSAPTPPTKQDVLTRLSTLKKPLQERGVGSLALFGSLVRGTARPESDIDLLIEVAPDHLFSLVD